MQQRWLTFDCYGTLIAWRRGLLDALSGHVGYRADAVLLDALAFAWAMETDGPYRSYRQILTSGLAAALEQNHLDGPATALVDAWPGLPVFEDVPPTLERAARTGWRFGVLTNCDDDLFAYSAAAIGVPFDIAVTAQQVQSYKANLAHFEEFRARSGVAVGRSIHVANSWYADVMPCQTLGIPCVWVNRDRDNNDPAAATAAIADFTGLAEAIDALAPPE